MLYHPTLRVDRLRIYNFVAYKRLTKLEIKYLMYFMSTHRPILATDEIYHTYNRSIGKQFIFNSYESLNKILGIVDYYKYPQRIKYSKFNKLPPHLQKSYLMNIRKQLPLVDINVFSFMPNHFHFLLKQLQDKGISQFLSNTQNSFAKIFNLQNDRDGGLFKNSFKAKRITNNEEFIHVSRYIHINHVTAGLIEFEQLLTYPWTSLPHYLASGNPQAIVPLGSSELVNTKPILDYFKTPKKYLKFLKDNVDYQRKLSKIKKLLLDS